MGSGAGHRGPAVPITTPTSRVPRPHHRSSMTGGPRHPAQEERALRSIDVRTRARGLGLSFAGPPPPRPTAGRAAQGWTSPNRTLGRGRAGGVRDRGRRTRRRSRTPGCNRCPGRDVRQGPSPCPQGRLCTVSEPDRRRAGTRAHTRTNIPRPCPRGEQRRPRSARSARSSSRSLALPSRRSTAAFGSPRGVACPQHRATAPNLLSVGLLVPATTRPRRAPCVAPVPTRGALRSRDAPPSAR
jgi:hypothetical protein